MSEDTARPTPAYRGYALSLLLVIYTLNFVDRQIVNILAEPIKHELGLADWQMGAMTGLAFAVFYTVLGVPLARVAERRDRSVLISLALVVWSGMTAVCGLAQSFVQLLVARIGVGVGEAGFTPAAQTLITDMTPKARRAAALAFFSMGVPLGSLLGMAIGGYVAEHWGWRAAFMVVGAPGVALALVTVLTLKDPRTRALRASGLRTEDVRLPELGTAFRSLLGLPSFWWMAVGAALTTMLGYGHQAFYGPFFLRNHAGGLVQLGASLGLGGGLGTLGLLLGLIVGIGGSLGTYLGGRFGDHFAQNGVQGYVIAPIWGSLLAGPLLAAVFWAPGAGAALLLLALPTVLKNMWYGPIYACVQEIVHTGSRATAMAIFLFVVNAVGLGVGPLALGALSDLLAFWMGPATGLRWAMTAMSIFSLAAAFCFWRAGVGLSVRRSGA